MSRRADFLHCDRMNFEDSQFVERIRRCDSEALCDVVESYLPHILNTARASGLAPERAEDVTQATFAVFLERASEFEGRSHVRTCLFGIFLPQDFRGAAWFGQGTAVRCHRSGFWCR